MTFESIVQSIPVWLNDEGPESSIVISSRTRLARNIAGYWYTHRADKDKLGEIVNEVLEAADIAGFNQDDFFRNSDLDDIKKNIFIERHLISPALAAATGNRGVLVKDNESCSIMVNEEDHLRIQCMKAGFDPMAALEEIADIEKKLACSLSFSYSRDYGYLTACPTNFGTGFRVSVLIHLPALVLTKEIQRVIRSAGQLGMVVRGYRGEGSDVVGNMFQISNQSSFGKTEYDIVQSLMTAVRQIIEYEMNTAEMLMKEAKHQIEDKIWRSIGILKTARVLSTHEFINLCSAVRLGIHLRILDTPDIKILNELMILIQPGHLQERIGRQLEPVERDVIRADLIRERFIDVKM